MNREQLVEKVCDTLRDYYEAAQTADESGQALYEVDWADTILAALLPQVTTAAELAALHRDALVVSTEGGCASAGNWGAQQMIQNGPLTVVWQPS